MLLFYSILFYGFHMVISAFWKEIFSDNNMMPVKVKWNWLCWCVNPQVWGRLLTSMVKWRRFSVFASNDWNCSVSCWLQSEHTQMDVCTPSYTCTHTVTHTTRTQRKTHSIQRRANQLSNRLSVLIFIIRLRTYGSALIRRQCVFLCVCVYSNTRTQKHRYFTEAKDIFQEV